MKAHFSSDKIEVLAQGLKEAIFSEEKAFFHTNYVFVESALLKEKITLFFADDPKIKVAANLHFVLITDFIWFFQNLLNLSKEEKIMPFFELNLKIEQKIRGVFLNQESFLGEQKVFFEPLLHYLNSALKNGSNKKLQRRISDLSDELTTLFIQYSFQEKELFNYQKPQNWQEFLFKEIFSPQNLFKQDFYSKLNFRKFDNCHFHFFATSFLPLSFLRFIDNFSNVCHYHLSFSLFFLEDLTTDFERRQIKKVLKKKKCPIKNQEELDVYLKDKNSFLANMSVLKREHYKQVFELQNYDIIDDADIIHEEKDLTFLKSVQNDFLQMRNVNDTPQIQCIDDGSLELHAATSKLREVQILKNNLLALLYSSNKEITPSDVCVMSFDIQSYLPFIQMVFDDLLSYRVLFIDLFSQSFLAKGLLHLLNLSNSRFDKNDLFALLDNPLFQKKFELTNEDALTLQEWISKSGFDLGLNYQHRQSFFNEKKVNDNSLEHNIKKLIASLVFMVNEDDFSLEVNFSYPIFSPDFTSSDLINKLIKIFSHLQDDIKFLQDDLMRPLQEWQNFLLKIYSTYFFVKPNQEIEKIFEKQFFQFVNKLSGDEKFSFATIFKHLKKELENKAASFHVNALQSIQFCSIEEGSKLPFKVVYVLGMNDDFPKLSLKSALSLIKNNFPQNIDKIKNQFLEIIFSARKKLYFSFVDPEKQLSCSNLLKEFLAYLDEAYLIDNEKPSKKIVYFHPASIYDKKYYANGRYRSFDEEAYKQAKAYYLNNTPHPISFISAKASPTSESLTISIKELRSFAKNPLRFFLNRTLGVYLETTFNKNEIGLSYLDKYLIREKVLKEPIEKLLFSAELKGKLTQNCFSKADKIQLQDEASNHLQNLQGLNIHQKDIFTLELKDNVTGLKQMANNVFEAPSIKLQVLGNEINIVGPIANSSLKGLIKKKSLLNIYSIL
ncbi:MAG: exodeoxyribonuclease V subunit gamma [Chlamydiae bacterium]|nr:exodeoxyribonuclease V subunit gamma [Chlamydiota bacterium]